MLHKPAFDLRFAAWRERDDRAGERDFLGVPFRRCERVDRLLDLSDLGFALRLVQLGEQTVVLGAFFFAEHATARADAVRELCPGHAIERDLGPGPAFAANLFGDWLKLFGGDARFSNSVSSRSVLARRCSRETAMLVG